MTGAQSVSAPLTQQHETQVSGKATYLEYLEGFRGLAIIFVVMIHANNAMLQRGVEGVAGQFSWVWTVFHILSHNSTVYFALISGILYAYWLHRKPHGQFLKSRFEAVVLPYAIISVGLTLLIAAMAAVREGHAPEPEALAGELVYNVVLGEAWNHLWYIPVITVLYVISPILLGIVRNRALIWLAAILVLLPLIASRTATEVTPSMLVYFTGVYTVGLLIGLDPERKLAQLQQYWKAIAGAALLAACAVAYLDWAGIEFIGFTSVRESAVYVLRIALAVLMLIALRLFSDSIGPAANRTLKLIAAYSFGIYFLHAPLLRPIVKVVGLIVPEGNPAWALVLGVTISFFASLALSMLLVKAIKMVTGKRSKFVIGS